MSLHDRLERMSPTGLLYAVEDHPGYSFRVSVGYKLFIPGPHNQTIRVIDTDDDPVGVITRRNEGMHAP